MIFLLLRTIKTAEEVNYIKKAAELADKGFDYILTRICPGISEREIALELEFFFGGTEVKDWHSLLLQLQGIMGPFPCPAY